MTPATASILIVGDEILAGHTQDTNSHWLAVRLRERGVRVRRIETLPDDVDVIVEALRRNVASAPSWLFVVGGLGPTPDDRTYEAVSKAFDCPGTVDPAEVERLKRRFAGRPWADAAWADPERSEPMVRMLRIPRGAHPLRNPVGAALGCVLPVEGTRAAVFPGVPKELYAMFSESFEPAYLSESGAAEVTREVVTRGAEARLWHIMVEVTQRWPEAKIGSYPQSDGRIVLRVSGPPGPTQQAAEHLERFLASEASGQPLS